jgi:O-antigen/teichoic acid export membrane protein
VAVTVAVTRNFGRAQAGVFFAATSLFLIASGVANLGAYNGVVYFVARYRALGRPDRIDGALRAAVRPVAVVSCLVAAVMFALARPVARLLAAGGVATGHAPLAATTTVRALAVALPFAAVLDTFLAATRGYRQMRPTVVLDKLARPGGQVLLVTVAAAAGSATLLAPAWALPYAPAAAAAWLWLRRVRRRYPAAGGTPHRRPMPMPMPMPAPARAAREFWRFTAPRSLATVAQIVIQRLDIVLVGVLRGPADAAVYTAATRFLVAGQLGNAAISMAAQPRFTELFALGDRRGANTVYQTTTAWLVVLTWPLYLLAMTYAPTVLAVFGHAYHAGTTVMLILGFAMLVATGCGLVDMVLTTTGRTTWSLANGLLAVIVNVGADLALIPRFGMAGAAIGWAAAIGVTNLVPLAQVAGVVRVHPFGRGTLASCGLATICFGVIPLLARMAAGSGVGTDAGAAAAGCALYAAGLWRLRDDLHLSAMPGLSRFVRTAPGHSGAIDQNAQG